MPQKPNFKNGSSPLYTQVADAVRERIVKGVWEVGSKIPSLKALAQEFDVALITVRQAIQVLHREGLLAPQRGRGTIVIGRPPVHPRIPLESSLDSLGRIYRTNPPKLRLLEEGSATPKLQPGDGSPAAAYHYIRRVHLNQRQANSVISIYLDERVFRLAPKRFQRELIIPVLLDLPEVVIAKAAQTLTIATAGIEAAGALDISTNAPVAEIRRVFCGPDGTVIFLGELVYRGDFIRWDVDLLAK